MLGNAHFYNRTIRKIVVAFGTMFNDIQLQRYNKNGTQAYEIFKVPLSYGTKEKYLTRITSDPDLTKSIATTVPRMSFELTGMSYDTSRKLPTTIRNFSANNSTTSLQTQYLPVPYDFEFSMSIYVRNTEDGTQILEQILPFFTPDFNVTVNFISGMDQKYDMPVKLNSVNTTTDYEGDFMSTRLIMWDLTFTAKAYIWPPVQNGKIIRQTTENIYINIDSLDGQRVTVNTANGFGVFTTGETIRVNTRDLTGAVVYFSNTSTGVLIANKLNKLLQVGDKVTGDYSNATYMIKSTDITPIKDMKIVTVPKPLTAEIDDEFGFSDTITNFPDA
jgi:hypothetical protein